TPPPAPGRPLAATRTAGTAPPSATSPGPSSSPARPRPTRPRAARRRGARRRRTRRRWWAPSPRTACRRSPDAPPPRPPRARRGRSGGRSERVGGVPVQLEDRQEQGGVLAVVHLARGLGPVLGGDVGAQLAGTALADLDDRLAQHLREEGVDVDVERLVGRVALSGRAGLLGLGPHLLRQGLQRQVKHGLGGGSLGLLERLLGVAHSLRGLAISVGLPRLGQLLLGGSDLQPRSSVLVERDLLAGALDVQGHGCLQTRMTRMTWPARSASGRAGQG